MIDIRQLKKQLERARLKYKPDRIKYLLIAEAAPDNIERFFYYEDVFKYDDLFLGVAKALYPTLKDKHLLSRKKKDNSIKKIILEKLKEDGFYLLDLSELPMSLTKESLPAQVPALIKKINNITDKNTIIILIKATVYDASFHLLTKAGFEKVINKKIDFPGTGGQKKFQIKFKEALKMANYV
jgi:predicted ATPase